MSGTFCCALAVANHVSSMCPYSVISFMCFTCTHGGLLSLNAWKLGPTPQNIEVVASPHSNEPSNRCPLEPAVHEVHET